MTTRDTYPMRTHIEQSNLIEDIKDPAEIDQSLKAWNWLMEQDEVNHGVIMGLQRRIVLNQKDLKTNQRGAYRDLSRTNVQVGGYSPPAWMDVQDLMDDWLDGLDGREPWVNHVYFEGIHPFADGNGRTGRMLMWREQLERHVEPTMIRAAERYAYYRDLSWYRLVHAASMLSKE